MSLSDRYVPFKMKTEAMIEAKGFAKVEGRKSSVFLIAWKSLVELNKV